jgi:hypothetical protein
MKRLNRSQTAHDRQLQFIGRADRRDAERDSAKTVASSEAITVRVHGADIHTQAAPQPIQTLDYQWSAYTIGRELL